MKMNSIFDHWILNLNVVVLICIIFGTNSTRAAYAEEPDWGQIISHITDKGSQNSKKNLNCVVELIFGKNGKLPQNLKERIINFSIVFPNTSSNPIISVNLLRKSVSEEKNVLNIIKDLHSEIVTKFGLNSSSCPYCMWPLVLPKVATDKKRVGNFLIFSENIELDDALFKGEATSTIAYDEDTLNLAWSDDQADTEAEILDIYLKKDILISPKDVKVGLHQINSSSELWDTVEKQAERIPQLALVLSILEKP